MSSAPNTRYVFANQLRGFAALCVVCVHLGGLYWVDRQTAAAVTFSPVSTAIAPPTVALFTTSWLNLGPFGVALFFLISGFVIPISLERMTPAAFLFARVFRIFPTYWVALAIELAVLAWGTAYWHHPFTYGAGVLLSNAFLANDIANLPSVDGVNWTLAVEIKFYVLMALLIVPIRRGSLIALFAIAAFILFVSRFSHDIFLMMPHLGNALRIFEMNALYVLFMLIGVVFSYHARGLIGNIRLWIAVPALFALFVICWPLTFFRWEFPSAAFDYGYALIIFGAGYAFRDAIKPSRVLDFFAAISYPLYLVHFLIGFSLMQILLSWNVNGLLATFAALAVTIAVAAGLHRAIELPSQGLGKTLSTRIFP